MIMKGCSGLIRPPELEPYHHMHFRTLGTTFLWGGNINPLQGIQPAQFCLHDAEFSCLIFPDASFRCIHWFTSNFYSDFIFVCATFFFFLWKDFFFLFSIHHFVKFWVLCHFAKDHAENITNHFWHVLAPTTSLTETLVVDCLIFNKTKKEESVEYSFYILSWILAK